jgi:hypothetical protein
LERLLLAINSASSALQAVNTDLSLLQGYLSMALGEVTYMRNSWESIIATATVMASNWKISPNFSVSRKRRTKKLFDELSSDERLQDPESAFRVQVFFYPIIDTAIFQLQSRFEGQHLVSKMFSFLFPKHLLQLSDEGLGKQRINCMTPIPLTLIQTLCPKCALSGVNLGRKLKVQTLY